MDTTNINASVYPSAGYKGSSDLYIDSNIQLALAAARQITTDTGKRVHILLPDDIEYRRAYKMYVDTFSSIYKFILPLNTRLLATKE